MKASLTFKARCYLRCAVSGAFLGGWIERAGWNTPYLVRITWIVRSAQPIKTFRIRYVRGSEQASVQRNGQLLCYSDNVDLN